MCNSCIFVLNKCTMKRNNKKRFIQQAKEVHGDKYDYSEIIYKNNRTPIVFTCKKYGRVKQLPQHHLDGKIPTPLNLTNKFIIDAKGIHGSTYDYSKSKYITAKETLIIVCKVHGEFLQKPYHHLQGSGCKKCGKVKTHQSKFLDKSKVIVEINDLIKDKGILLDTNYTTINDKIKVSCKHHGLFNIKVDSLLKGKWCQKCASDLLKSNKFDFIKKANKIHNNIYDYSKVDYVNSTTKVKIICPNHGEFEQIPNGHLNGNGCEKCQEKYSKGEKEVSNFLSKKIELVNSDKDILKNKELDIYIPSKKIAIEYNGLYWHSDKFKDKNYHLDKTIECSNNNIKLIHIFEDEWKYKQDIVESRLLSILGVYSKILYARNTEVKEVPTKQAMQFLEDNHLQGKLGAKIKVGLYFNNELISIMTFGGIRVNLGGRKKEDNYELLRFCSKQGYNVIGGASKLLKYFERTYNPKEIISYADLRWSEGKVYEKLNFKLVHKSQPNYFYTKGTFRENRFKFRKDVLIKQGFDKNKTERQIMKDLGYHRIYDCGTLKYLLKFNT